MEFLAGVLAFMLAVILFPVFLTSLGAAFYALGMIFIACVGAFRAGWDFAHKWLGGFHSN